MIGSAVSFLTGKVISVPRKFAKAIVTLSQGLLWGNDAVCQGIYNGDSSRNAIPAYIHIVFIKWIKRQSRRAREIPIPLSEATITWMLRTASLWHWKAHPAPGYIQLTVH